MLRQLTTALLLGLTSFSLAGCCCVQGMPGGACGPCGPCGPGPIASLAGCRGGCGEVYVDEWISEPPVVDNCGYDCGGCGACSSCRPLLDLWRLLWGRPYVTQCSTGLCGPSCEDGCDSCGGGVFLEGGDVMFDSGGHTHGRSCNCGQTHGMGAMPLPYGPESVAPMPQAAPPLHGGPHAAPLMPGNSSMPLEVLPQPVPEYATPRPAPAVTPSSATRLNPALARRRR